MRKYLTIIAVLVLSSCSGIQNREGKMLDASSGYCQDMRVENPELYYDTCESTGGWKARDSKGYARSYKNESVTRGIAGAVLVEAADQGVDEALDAITK